MKRREFLTLSFTVVAGHAWAQWPSAQSSGWDPYKGARAIVDWFADLNKTWKVNVVDPLSRDQINSIVPRLKRALHSCVQACIDLRSKVPDNPPTEDQARQIDLAISDLMTQIRNMRSLIMMLGDDLHMTDKTNDIDELLSDQLAEKRRQLFYVKNAVIKAKTGTWNSGDVRSYLDAGIQIFQTAEQAVAEFEHKFA